MFLVELGAPLIQRFLAFVELFLTGGDFALDGLQVRELGLLLFQGRAVRRKDFLAGFEILPFGDQRGAILSRPREFGLDFRFVPADFFGPGVKVRALLGELFAIRPQLFQHLFEFLLPLREDVFALVRFALSRGDRLPRALQFAPGFLQLSILFVRLAFPLRGAPLELLLLLDQPQPFFLQLAPHLTVLFLKPAPLRVDRLAFRGQRRTLRGRLAQVELRVDLSELEFSFVEGVERAFEIAEDVLEFLLLFGGFRAHGFAPLLRGLKLPCHGGVEASQRLFQPGIVGNASELRGKLSSQGLQVVVLSLQVRDGFFVVVPAVVVRVLVRLDMCIDRLAAAHDAGALAFAETVKLDAQPFELAPLRLQPRALGLECFLFRRQPLGGERVFRPNSLGFLFRPGQLLLALLPHLLQRGFSLGALDFSQPSAFQPLVRLASRGLDFLLPLFKFSAFLAETAFLQFLAGKELLGLYALLPRLAFQCFPVLAQLALNLFGMPDRLSGFGGFALGFGPAPLEFPFTLRQFLLASR